MEKILGTEINIIYKCYTRP